MNESDFDYTMLTEQARGLLSVTGDPVANAAILSALIYHECDRINWVGFYFLHGNELVVGPFQGKPACVRIDLGKGVCGTAASERCSLRVDDVRAFDSHIVCDVDSRSELVIPLLQNDELLGVLDIDSPDIAHFTEDDQRGFEQLAVIYIESVQELI